MHCSRQWAGSAPLRAGHADTLPARTLPRVRHYGMLVRVLVPSPHLSTRVEGFRNANTMLWGCRERSHGKWCASKSVAAAGERCFVSNNRLDVSTSRRRQDD